MRPEILRHLAAVDPVMGRIIRQHGTCGLKPEIRRPPFQSLVQAVAHQQLHGAAASTILSRFIKLFPGRRFPRAEDLASVTDEQIRACGFSFAKIRAIRDLAEKTLSGLVPSSRQIRQLTDEEIILTARAKCPSLRICGPTAKNGARIAPPRPGISGAPPTGQRKRSDAVF